MTTPRTALVTGANQGIGRAIVTELARRWTPADRVLLTGRDADRVAAAVREIGHPGARVEGGVLDVGDPVAIAAFARDLGPVDVVFSNAATRLTPDRPQADQAGEFVAVANGATHAMLREVLPNLRPGGRFIVVASGFGQLHNLPEHLRPRFDGATLDEVERVVDGWLAAVLAGSAAAEGWPELINTTSKIAQVAAVRAVARERRDADLAAGTLIASVCPGLVDTPASRPWFDDFSQARTPAQAATALLDFVLAAPPRAEIYGELVRDGGVLPWKHDHPGAR
ncbi:SDR family NAD(P)-dependent oxidoreductase [Actinokineospora enzanensis]|uniref:SDR family NAD(P)-dependent oxidoreductase n=1 Tax=Actinokineospora enzanensis TaxID=155975 RepID=UPI000367E31F|nr:SDR family NAD(P)-dependent oxidoreductase [Actinokineospora enzanensis]